MPNLTTPPRLFAIISLLMIVTMVITTGLTQAPFFRQTVIDRESVLVRDMVNSLALEHSVSTHSIENYTSVEAREQLDRSFKSLRKLSGTQRIKVFNRDNTIVWSDDPDLVGTKRSTHIDDLARAWGGEASAVFVPARTNANIFEQGPPTPESIEVYVPIFQAEKDEPEAVVIGVLSLYRSPLELNRTILEGLYLLWTVIGVAGALLFSALYALFVHVYSRQKTVELQFTKLTAEHERIVQLEKLSAMGEMVSEIAHQINNPLVGVINLTQIAERDPDTTERMKRLLAAILKSGIECSDFVQRLLRLNQIARSEPQPVAVNDLVQDTIAFFHQTIGKQHTVIFEAPGESVVIEVDPVLIRHALFNLIHNAILAAPGKPVQIAFVVEACEGVPGYLLSVTDGGSGFDAVVAQKLFKPFFTTRPGGTGLGLSVAQFIAMKHGGSMRAENVAGGGARFSIWLPAATKS